MTTIGFFDDGTPLSLEYSGYRDSPIIISAEPNKGFERTATITIESVDSPKITKTLVIRQPGLYGVLRDCHSQVIVDSEGVYLKTKNM